ncbi:hypothetical protein EJ08DRAFT_462595 [Tothia fuscella]|uniref:Uncharacterized protein n=1 Tax=Tothia fuscella TaxID=1048955 RepID=A0A9P4TTM2_9PEZI|nr:hypothetical protein EJ08DRAFT_462595 [Tothia fuscella]
MPPHQVSFQAVAVLTLPVTLSDPKLNPSTCRSKEHEAQILNSGKCQKRMNLMRTPGIEPGSASWEPAMLSGTPSTLATLVVLVVGSAAWR